MIFLTVGTQFPFDRLIKAVDEVVGTECGNEEVFGQIGASSYRPRNFRAVVSLDKERFDRYFRESSGIIGHAGMGTISLALEWNKPLLALPRRAKYGEAVNDHQMALAEEFEALGHILVARNAGEVATQLTRLKSFTPKHRVANPDVVAARISGFLQSMNRTH